jgi:hypothetical protein
MAGGGMACNVGLKFDVLNPVVMLKYVFFI